MVWWTCLCRCLNTSQGSGRGDKVLDVLDVLDVLERGGMTDACGKQTGKICTWGGGDASSSRAASYLGASPTLSAHKTLASSFGLRSIRGSRSGDHQIMQASLRSYGRHLHTGGDTKREDDEQRNNQLEVEKDSMSEIQYNQIADETLETTLTILEEYIEGQDNANEDSDIEYSVRKQIINELNLLTETSYPCFCSCSSWANKHFLALTV